MLRRQRTILKLLVTANGSVSATQLQKYLFLLREETFLRDDAAFYEFLPHRFGPYSFVASRELDALAAYGYIEATTSAHLTSLHVSALGIDEAKRADDDTSRAVSAIVSRYAKNPLRDLLKDVYARYSWYASRSELKELVPVDSPRAAKVPKSIYTAGYEGRSVDGFLNVLLKAGIKHIIDVRANPVSRKYGFARSSLSGIAGKVGIGYIHCPELGISSEKRKDVRSSLEFRQLFSYYERQILPRTTGEIASVAERMKASPSVLVCMEKQPQDCHRGRLAAHLAGSTGMDIVHL